MSQWSVSVHDENGIHQGSYALDHANLTESLKRIHDSHTVGTAIREASGSRREASTMFMDGQRRKIAHFSITTPEGHDAHLYATRLFNGADPSAVREALIHQHNGTILPMDRARDLDRRIGF